MLGCEPWYLDVHTSCFCSPKVGDPKWARALGVTLYSSRSELCKQAEGPEKGGSSWGPSQGQQRCLPPQAPSGTGRRQLQTAQAAERSRGESSHCVWRESGGRETLSQDSVLCPAPPPPPPVSGSPILGGWVGGWLSALPLALKLSTVVPTGGGDRLGVMRASPSRRQFSGPSPRGRPSELPRAVRKLSQRSLSGDGSLLRGTETRRGRSGPALWV